MIRLNKTDQYLLGNVFSTAEQTGEIPENSDASLFTDIQNLFSEGMTEEDFISQYQQLVAGSMQNTGADENNKLNLSSISSAILDNIKEIAQKYFKFVDKDGNGIISAEEVSAIAQKDGDSASISEDDINLLTAEIFPEETQTADQINITKPQYSNFRSSGSSGSYGPKNNNTSSTPTEAMTLEQLQQQKSQKQGDLDSSDELKQQNAQVSEAYSAKEAELGSLKSGLVDVNANISKYNSIIASNNSDLSALKTALSNIDSSKPNAAEMKTEIEGKISTAEANIREAQQKLNEENNKKTELEGKISTAQAELTELGAKKTEVEALIAENGNDATKEALKAYQQAQTDAQAALKTAEANVVSLQGEVDKIDKQINDKQASKIQTDYRQTKLDKTYTLNGEEYLSLFSQDELDAFLRGEYSRGNYNHDSNCLSMSYVYSNDIMRQLGISGSSTDFISDDQSAVEQKAREALDNGYPVIMHVSTQRGTRHFATAVGYRVTNEGKLVFLLADNVQGVGITACGEGERRHMITGYSTPYKNQNYGYRCLFYS